MITERIGQPAIDAYPSERWESDPHSARLSRPTGRCCSSLDSMYREILVDAERSSRSEETVFHRLPNIQIADELDGPALVRQSFAIPHQWTEPRVVHDEVATLGNWMCKRHRCVNVLGLSERGHTMEIKWFHQQHGGARLHLLHLGNGCFRENFLLQTPAFGPFERSLQVANQ